MPKILEPGVLYVAEEFGAAAHLCPCGCGAKIRTPLGSTEWTVEETNEGPSLYPSVGNWQQTCRSHYWIRRGRIVWSEDWSEDQVWAGRQMELERRTRYYETKGGRRSGLFARMRRLFVNLFRR